MKTYHELKALIDQRGVHDVFGPYGEGQFIEQNAEELAHFLVHMQELGVESVLEIGTGWKAGLARFLHDDMGWTVTSVDIHDYGHQFGGILFVTADVEPYSDETFDLVIIDGDHSYEGVKADHERWLPHAEKVIAFHDTVGLRDCEGVQQYWREIAYEGKALKSGYYEIVAEGEQRGGIGYIVLSEVVAEPEAPAEAEKPAPKKAPARKTAAKRTAKQ